MTIHTELFNDFQKWREEEVASVEALIGASLPDQFRRFLLEVGSGGLHGMRVVPETNGNGLLNNIFDTESMSTNWESPYGYSVIIPKIFLAIGSGAGGAMCVGLTGETVGRVYWADYDQAEEMGLYDEDPPARSERVLREVFPTWRAFVDNVPKWQVV